MQTLAFISGFTTLILITVIILKSYRGQKPRKLAWISIGTTVLFVIASLLRVSM